MDVEICDVTLRDGEQTPGVSFTREAKIEIAYALDEIGIDVIEAGFPVVSKEEAEIVHDIANLGLKAKICALSRAKESDVDCVASCDVDIISIVFGTSDLHLRYKYGITEKEAIRKAVNVLDYAKEYGLSVRFAAEDATRADLNFLKRYFKAGEEHGADILSIADTVGALNPRKTRILVGEIMEITDLPICIHCHDDLGLALANTLAAAEVGAKQLHATVNGIGERAGNTALEELLLALHLQYGIERYDLSHLRRLSKMVERYAGISVAKNKAVVGDNAFTHESGIHVAAVLDEPSTYELFQPELIGGERRFAIGKHTGRRALKHIIGEEYELGEEEVLIVLNEVKEMKKSISKRDLIWLVSKERVKRCSACELHETRKNVVFGEGDADADIIFIGEAPGSNEDLQGRPFVGAAGRILDEMLSAVRLKRESVYITNILKCRPPKNRNPKKDEIDVCAPYLDGQIEAINPKVICTLGNFASEYILEKFGFHPESIGKIHGKTFDLQDLRIVPLYHPATAVYNPGMKAVLIDDIKKTLG